MSSLVYTTKLPRLVRIRSASIGNGAISDALCPGRAMTVELAA